MFHSIVSYFYFCIISILNILVLSIILFRIVFLVSHIYNWLVEIKEKQSYLIKTHSNASIVGTHLFLAIK